MPLLRVSLPSMFLALWVFFTVIVPETSLAVSPLNLLEEDVERVERLLEDDREDMLLEVEERTRAGSKDLFPEPPPDAAEESSEKHVSFQEGTTLITLWDVPAQSWFAPYVRFVAVRGIVSGYRDASGKPVGAFGPGNPVLIEELAKVSVEAGGLDPASCGDEPRNEGARGRWSAPYIACAEGQGWAVFSDGTVDVTRPALRNEVIVTILQAFRVPIMPLSGTGQIFSDVPASIQFASAIETAARDGIVSGTQTLDGRLTGEFKPMSPVNRAEVAKMLTLALKRYAK